MILYKLFIRRFLAVLTFGMLSLTVSAQQQILQQPATSLLHHANEQFGQGHYVQALRTYEQLLREDAPGHPKPSPIPDAERQQIAYGITICRIKLGTTDAAQHAEMFIRSCTEEVYRQRAAFALAQYYFQQNKLEDAIVFYEMAGIEHLSNEEIIDKNFESGYAYFNEHRFEKAKALFASIKEFEQGKYYVPGNYYYGLLAYNDGQYDQALRSFNRIESLDEYKDIVPYYIAEIYYFKSDYEKVLGIAQRYLNKKDTLYYNKELHLLAAQTHFERKEYEAALPYFEFYYNNSDKIRKEELYELAYTYYRLEKWNKAIVNFRQLSDLKDSLGQTSMYLLGDCYLKTNDKKGARNAFGFCADMDFNPDQKEAATFLYAKLSAELGYEAIATHTLSNFIHTYPQSSFMHEARLLLTDLLSKSSNFADAFAVISELPVKDNATWAIYQKVAVGRAMQLMQNKSLAMADSVFNLSLQQPIDADYEAITYFWKSEIAYREGRFPQAVQFAHSFLSKSQKGRYRIGQISPQATMQHAWLNIGYANMALEEFEAAREAFAQAQTATDKDPANGWLAVEALLREADAAFMMKDFDRALMLYDKSLASAGLSNPDYAIFQKALILGLQHKSADKMAMLRQIISRTPESPEKDKAQYELALSYLESGRNTEAISLLQELAADESALEGMRSKALLKQAYAFQISGNNEQALKLYKDFLVRYPASGERVAAIDALRNLYISLGRPQDFAAFVNANQLPDINTADIDHTYYAAAENEYAANNYTKAIELFSKYLSSYPNGLSVLKAQFYLAECYLQTGDSMNALKYYEMVLEEGWSDFSETAAEQAGGIAMRMQNYAAASNYYQQLLDNAIAPANLQKAYEGLMIAAFNMERYNDAIRYADTLIRIPNSTYEREAGLYKANALTQLNKWEDALLIYKDIEKNSADAIGAEARYHIAAILLEQNKLKEAESYASYAMQAGTGNDYWVVKTYLLMADILTAEKDYFNAKATLQSIIKHTKDETLKSEANAKLNEVKELEKQGSKLSEE